MTIDELNVIIGADDTALGRGLASAISKLQGFATSATAAAAQAGQGLDGFANRAGAAGTRAADNLGRGFSSLNTKLSATFAAADAQVKTLEAGIGRLGQAMQSAGKAATLGVTLPILAFGVASIKSAGDMEALELAFKAVYKGAGDVGQSLKNVKTLAEAPGLGVEQAVRASVSLQAAGLSAKQAESAIKEFGNVVAASGNGAPEFERIAVQLAQLASASKVTGADLKPIIAAAPKASEALLSLYGTINAGDIQAKLAADGKSTKDFVAEFTTELQKVPRVAGGINSNLENIGDSVKSFLATVGTSLNKSLNLDGAFKSIKARIDGLSESFASLSPGTQKLIFGLGLAAAAVGPLLVAIGTIGVALPAVTAGFAALGVTSVAALAPILPIAAAVAAAAYLIYNNWEDIAAYFNGEGGKLISGALVSTKGAVSALIDAFSKLFSLVGGGDNFGGLISASGILKAVFKDITIGITALGDTVASVVNFAVNLLSGNFRQALQNIGDVLDGLTLPIRSLLGLVNDAKWENTAMSSFFNAASKAKDTAGEWEKLADASVKAAAADEKARLAAEQHKKTLGGLKEALSAAKDKLDTLVGGTAEFATTKAEIVRLSDLIKKLEDTGKAAKKASDDIAKAFADIRAKLAAVDTRVQIGVELNYDGLLEKVKILQDGIKSLTIKGVSENSPALQGLVRQLAGAQAQVEKVKAAIRGILATSATTGDGKDIYTIDVAKIQQKLDAANLKAELQFNYDKDLVKLKQALADAADAAQQELITAGVPTGTSGAGAIGFAAADTKNAAFDASSLQGYLKAMQDINAEQKLFGAGFNGSAAALSVTADRLRDLIALGQQATPEFAKLTEGMKTLKQAADWSDFQQSATAALSSMLTELGSLVGEQLGNVLAGVSSGQDALESVFLGVLGLFGGFLVDLGKMLIQYGILQLAAAYLASNPYTAPAAIAVGIAAIAIGTAFKSASSKGPSGKGASSGSSYSPSSSSGSSPRSTANNSRTEIVVRFEPVELRADGASLRSVMRVDDYRLTQNR